MADLDATPKTSEKLYPLAERNRRAKMKFLSSMKDFYENKRKASLESTKSNAEKNEKRKIDLSVPGTPVSTRYLSSLSRENDNEEFELPEKNQDATNEIIVSSLIIDKFLQDMKNLDPENNHEKLNSNKVIGESFDDDQTNTRSECIQSYFEKSQEIQTYHRSFSQAAQTLHTAQVKSPVVKRYFDESSAKQTYSRDFNEAFKEIDPIIREEDPLQPKAAKFKYSVPGTPISSKHLDKFKNKHYISDSSDDEENDAPKNVEDPLDKFIIEMEKLKELKEQNKHNIKKTTLTNDFCVNKYLESSDTAKAYSRSFSEAAQELHSTDVKSPTVKEYFNQSDEQKTYRREFSEVYQQLSKSDEPGKSENHTEHEDRDDKTVSSTVVQDYQPIRYDSLEELYGKFKPVTLEEKPEPSSGFCVDSYMTSSDSKKSYTRTFSEAEQTLFSSEVKAPAVRNYFNESNDRNTYRRGFSEVYQQLGGSDLSHDLKKMDSPSSVEASSDQSEFNIKDTLLDKSSNKHTKHSISVPGTPINSRKLFPKEKAPPIDVPKATGSVLQADTLISPRLHDDDSRGIENAIIAPVPARRSASAAENSLTDEFWKKFGADHA
ncbi:uncharacterized protein LOC129759344 [Uranotaenia lowii]|uniref:uncharacterized protein LOC129759344 n=1 Tax=Uranotaenia lowii TaxID=190385 RepID=UPI00247962FA|nr:uncharacterized protein LOC129759344 [Uranotaenia lowii]